MSILTFAQVTSVAILSGVCAFGGFSQSEVRMMGIGYLCAVVPLGIAAIVLSYR